ncbi:DUF1512 domain-containing protein [Candidatus Bathyarchaeota archaeon]|nr:DUF1512 domain-containing protein [Candidatus Bathyarchaeota archaeon]
MFQLLGQLLQQDSEIGMILQTLFSFAFIIYLFYAQRIQGMTMLRQIEVSLRKIKDLRDKGKGAAIEAIKTFGKPEKDPTHQVERFMDHFMIPPIDMDPSGVVQKLGSIINVREFTFQKEVEQMAPQATQAQRNNLENLLEASLALNIFYKVIRHYYLMGKKTMNIYIIMQIHMILPMLIQQIEAYSAALQAFRDGVPIGDSVGPIVAAKLLNGAETREVAKEMVAGEIKFEGRRIIVTKAFGPGGSVGKPGDAIENLIKAENGKVRMLITVDAAGKLEGEEVGEIAEGVGAAIGGPGVEKYKMEAAAISNNIPLFAVAIKQGMEHVVAPLVEELMDATDKAVSSVKGLILDYSDEGDTIIVAGIGNTVGVAQ